MREILQVIVDSQTANPPPVLCTLVETRGSTPQKAGASMLVFADGTQAGTLGGGCVEAEVKRKVLAIENNQPRLFQYTLDDDYGWDDGLICGGRMSIIAQQITPAEHSYFRAFHEHLERGAGCCEIVVLKQAQGRPLGARLLCDSGGTPVQSIGEIDDPVDLAEVCPDLAARPRPHITEHLAVLPILPRCHLLIVGAGHVGQAVAEMAHPLEFDVTIVDDREFYASEERFPKAQRRIVGDMDEVLPEIHTDNQTYVIIVTRGHAHDEKALYHVINKPNHYVGMIGSKRKIRLIFEDLEAMGVDAESLRRVHAPLGLSIGSQTVPEIAISILAELVAHRNLGVSPDHLRQLEAVTSGPAPKR